MEEWRNLFNDIIYQKLDQNKYNDLIKNKIIDIHHNEEELFRMCCELGFIEEAKWLYSFGNLNIHARDEEAFCYACACGNLEIAQWLYSLGQVNIHAQNNYAFNYSEHHPEVQDWLNSLLNK